MNLAKVSDQRKLEVCRKYFIGGFFLLPFLWLVNACWFYSWAFKQPSFPQQRQMRKYVVFSGTGAGVWLAALVAWQIIYQSQRVSWGLTGDELSFFLPLGRL